MYVVCGRVQVTLKQKTVSFGWFLVATSECISRVGKQANQTEGIKRTVLKSGQLRRIVPFTGMTIAATQRLILCVCFKSFVSAVEFSFLIQYI